MIIKTHHRNWFPRATLETNINAKACNKLSHWTRGYLAITVSLWGYFLFHSRWHVKNCLCSHTVRDQWTCHISACKPQTHMTTYLSVNNRHVRPKSELAFIITSTYSKYNYEYVKLDTCAFPCEGGYCDEVAKDTTCRNQFVYVPTCPVWKCLHMTFGPSVTAKVCVCVTTVKWTCPPQMENKKRGRRQRCSRVPSVQMWVWKDTHV